MANTILDRYGIKEVADVTFYEINEDESRGKPVLYLDTLKVSTIEQTAESTDARGGKGNAALITWDYGKEITVTLEDALFSAKSLAMMFGDETAMLEGITSTGTVYKTLWKENLPSGVNATATSIANVKLNNSTATLTNCTFYDAVGTPVTSGTNFAYVTGTLTTVSHKEINVDANAFPGNYYITGDTYARNEVTGDDEFFQFVIPKAKVLSESVTLTLEAEGDPTVFSMNLKVLRPKNGIMMQLIQYTL